MTLPIHPDRRIRRLLVATRGEAAVRLIQAARAASVESVVLFAEEDAEALWVDEADFAVYVPHEEGPWPAPERVVSAGVDSGCDAVHPGWGALCRSIYAAELVARGGMGWLGPSPRALEAVADRTAQRAAAERLGIPRVPGSEPVVERAQVDAWLAWAGVPALLKPVDTLGLPGRSLRIDDPSAAATLLADVLAEGPALLERLVLEAREIEVPVLAGEDGVVATLADRETTVRSGLDRLLVECPAPDLPDALRAQLHRDAARIAEALGWRGVGAVRFLLTPDGRPWFLGLRPGLTAWHAVTEVALGMDFVSAELHLASGGDLALARADLQPTGHCVLLRVPVASTCSPRGAPSSPGVTAHVAAVDGDAIAAGACCGSVVVQAPTRQAALVRARALLDAWPMQGADLDDAPLRRLFDDPAFWQGPVHREHAATCTGLGARALPGRRWSAPD